MSDYASFRQELDAVLRTLDVKQVQDFLLAQGQWSPGAPADPEFAMWLMIAGSATLQDLHERAREWLVSHGHEAEAQAVLGRAKQREAQAGKKRQHVQDTKKRSSSSPDGHVRKQNSSKHGRQK
jgi:hypothetical protein